MFWVSFIHIRTNDIAVCKLNNIDDSFLSTYLELELIASHFVWIKQNLNFDFIYISIFTKEIKNSLESR